MLNFLKNLTEINNKTHQKAVLCVYDQVQFIIPSQKGVLSVELALSVLSRPPGVEVFLGTPEPKPMGLGRSVLLPDRMLEVLLTPDPRRPSSDSLRLMLEPYLLPGLEPWAEARLS